MAHHRTRLTPVTGAYRWIMFPYRVLAVISDALMRWLRDALKGPAK